MINVDKLFKDYVYIDKGVEIHAQGALYSNDCYADK